MAETGHNRRTFFREFIKRVVDPVAAYAEQRLPQERTLLRPPGALPERAFLDTCYRCGNCADSCPVEAIQHSQSEDEALRGTPVIDPDRQPCIACDGLHCMSACPSGALVPTPLAQIAMGLARVDEQSCQRSSGEDCRLCIDACPTTEKALAIDETARLVVYAEHCIGCGLCQHVCPTTPKAIVVHPT
jgi:ferredoxin-type protein NapG